MNFNKINGNLNGKPTEAGEFVLTFIASNDVGRDSKDITLIIEDPDAESDSGTESETVTKDVNSKELEDLQQEQTQETESEQETKESKIIYGESQSLSAEAIKNFTDKGFIVIAELPEIRATKSGQYDIDLIIELDESIETGKKLYYFAMPQGVTPSEDDEIVEFYDESGQEIFTIPESHKIKISAWLTEGVIYRPVICVEAETK